MTIGKIYRIGVVCCLLVGWTLLADDTVSVSKPETPEELQPAELADLLNRAYRQAVRRVAPAVVALKIYPSESQPGDADKAYSIGSGCLVDKEGYLITSYHLVRDAGKIEISLADGQLYPSIGVWTDPDTDLAIVRIKPGEYELPVANFGDSDQAFVGDPVLAIGSPFGLNQTVTSGIISCKGRETPNQILGEWGYEDFIQTDAVINRGNSGGPLINLRGEIIGINANILTPTGYSTGYGFAVPSNLARWVAGELIKRKQVVRGYLGAALLPLSLDELKRKARSDTFGYREAIPALARIPDGMNGVMVVRITPNSPAMGAGMRPYDVILEIDGQAVLSSREFRGYIARQRPGTQIRCKVLRMGQMLDLAVLLTGRELARQQADRLSAEEEAGQGGYKPLPGMSEPQPNPPFESASPLQTPTLGISVKTMDDQVAGQYLYPPDQKGVIITSVKPGSLAAKAGLQAGMILLKANGQSLENPVNGREILRVAVMEMGPEKPELRLTVKYKSVEDLEIVIKYKEN